MKTLHYTAQICESRTYSSWFSMLVTLINNDHAQTVTADSANSYKRNQIEQGQLINVLKFLTQR